MQRRVFHKSKSAYIRGIRGESFLFHKQIFCRDARMPITLALLCRSAELDGLHRAPLQAGHALLAIALPLRLAVFQVNVMARADPGA